MKKFVFTLLSSFFLLGLSAQQVGEKIQIESAGTWYNGVVKNYDPAEDKYFVSYEGWSDGFDEWVTKDRIKTFQKVEAPKAPLTKFKVGDKVEVEYGMVPEPATIMEVGENKYRIKYDKSVFGEKWVTERQIKKL